MQIIKIKKNTQTKENTIQNNKFNNNMTFMMLLSLIKMLITKKNYSINTFCRVAIIYINIF